MELKPPSVFLTMESGVDGQGGEHAQHQHEASARAHDYKGGATLLRVGAASAGWLYRDENGTPHGVINPLTCPGYLNGASLPRRSRPPWRDRVSLGPS